MPHLNTVCHLGHHLSYNVSDDEDINRKCHDFLKKANILLVNFKFCSPSTLTFLFRSFCLNFPVRMCSMALRFLHYVTLSLVLSCSYV